MSDVMGRSLNRRQFIRGGLAMAAGVATLGPARVFGQDREDCTRWAFLSDTHVAADPDNHYRGFYPYRNLREIAGQITYDPPDGVVITGDLARLKGEVGAYENFKTLVAPIAEQRPIYLGLGNHDDRDDFYRAFEHPTGGAGMVGDRHVVAEAAGPIRLIVLDSLLYVDTNPGLLGHSQRAWLDTYLRVCDDRPTIIFVHHTPRIDLLDTRRLFDIIGPSAKVKAVVFGHSHKLKLSEYKGIHLINLPATGYNFSGSEPVGWVEAKLTARGGEFTLHAVGGNRRDDGRSETVRWRA